MLTEEKLLNDARIDKEKEYNKKALKEANYSNSKTKYSYSKCKDSITIKPKTIHLTAEDVLSMEKIDIDKTRFAAYNEGKFFSVAKNPSKLDYKFMNLIFDKKTIGVFFSNKKSSSINIMRPNTFYSKAQFNDNYYMPVTLKDINKRKVIARTSEDCDIEGEVHKVGGAVSYITTDRGNINSVRALMFDVDCHMKEDEDDKYDIDSLCHSFAFFAKEEGISPTVIINSGRGFQVIYVLKTPLFRNSEKIDNLIKTSYKVLKDIIDKDVLPQIDTTVKLKCDKAINPVNQKMRMPGTLNFKSYTYSHVVYCDEESLYNLGEILAEKLGDYDDYLEKKKIKKEKAKAKKVSKHKGNNGNGRNNIIFVLERRINDIKKAMILCREEFDDGFRNNGYFTLVWQMLNLSMYNKKTDKEIADDIFRFDIMSNCNYFANEEKAEKYVESVKGTMSRSKNVFLKNSAIEEFCAALNIAKEIGIDFEIFFKETTIEKRDKKRIFKEEEKNYRIDKIKKKVLDGKSVTTIANEINVCRNTIYKYIREILEKEGMNLDKINESVLIVLKAILIRLVLKDKKRAFHYICPADIIYILFNTEKVNNEKLEKYLEEYLDIFIKKRTIKNEKEEPKRHADVACLFAMSKTINEL